jgi:hypothetical protein
MADPAAKHPPQDVKGTPQSDITAKLPDNGYRFTVTSDLSRLEAEQSGVEGPRGVRMHVVYGHGSKIAVRDDKLNPERFRKPTSYLHGQFMDQFLKPDKSEADWKAIEQQADEYNESGWKGLVGSVLSGSDFLQIRADGVIELDGRVTLRADDQTLIDARYSGLIDLDSLLPGPLPTARPTRTDVAKTSPGYEQFVHGRFTKDDLPLMLFITFDTSTGPWSTENAEDVTWTKPSQDRHRGNVWKYAEYVRRQYLGVGTMSFEHSPGKLPRPRQINVDVYDVAHYRGGAP